MPTYAYNSEEDFQRAARAIRRSERTPVNKRAERGRYPIGVDGGGGGEIVIGYATSTILPAESNLTGSAFTFVRLVVDGNVDPQTTPKTLKRKTDGDDVDIEETGVNRSTQLSGRIADFIRCHRNNGEWVVFYIEDECPD